MPAKLTPVMIFVKNFDECLEFYRDVFELTPMNLYKGSKHPPYVEFKVDEKTFLALHGDYVGDAHKQGNPIALHFQVSDLRTTIETAREHGGKVIQGIRRLDFREFAEHQLVEDARIADPDGNELELRQVLEEVV
jgi:predicted enzyme related to lactoylglutathione lyase